jgi:hypothetical protein
MKKCDFYENDLGVHFGSQNNLREFYSGIMYAL